MELLKGAKTRYENICAKSIKYPFRTGSTAPSIRTHHLPALWEEGDETAATFERMYGYRDFFERKMYGNKGDNTGNKEKRTGEHGGKNN